MHAWRVVRYGRPTEALSWDKVDEPVPGEKELVVAVKATSCNYNEVDGCYGRYRTVDPPVPYVLGMEVLGEVVAAGPGQEHWLGRRVMATAVGAYGGHAERALVYADMTLDAPRQLDDHQAAAFFFPFHVAHLALFNRGYLREGQTLLVHAGAGGVGSAAVQLGVSAGARVIATAGSDEKLDFCRELGADVAINYRTTEIAPALLEATGGEGVDVVCDLVGGKTALATFPAVKAGGRHVMAGFSGGIEVEDEGFPPRPVVFGNFDLCGAMMSYRADDIAGTPGVPGVHPFPRSVAESVQAHLVELLEAGKIRPVIGRVASHRELPVELERMESRTTTGRTILDWTC